MLDPDAVFSPKMAFGKLFHTYLEDKDLVQPLLEEMLTENMESVEAIHEADYQARWAAEGWKKKGPKYNSVEKERRFFCPYKVDGTTVYLHGFIDDIEKVPGQKKIRVVEFKTRGAFTHNLDRKLQMNAQSMLYHVALKNIDRWVIPDEGDYEEPKPSTFLPATGTTHIVLLRPGSHIRSPRKRKKESKAQLLKRTIQWYLEHFEDQWEATTVPITTQQIARFEERWLVPTIRQFLQWYSGYKKHRSVWDNPYHWQQPFGVWDGIQKGFDGDYFSLLTGGR